MSDILLVEDKASLRNVMRLTLENAGTALLNQQMLGQLQTKSPLLDIALY
jgi:CheY-like chemotaxis protein